MVEKVRKRAMIEVRCPECNQLRTIYKRHKYESTTVKLCQACVPKVNRIKLNSKH